MDSTTVTIRVKPGASRTRVGGSYGDALVVAVQARAVDGNATEAALKAVAAAVNVRRRDVRLVTGVTNRTKIVELPGGREVSERLASLISGAAH